MTEPVMIATRIEQSAPQDHPTRRAVEPAADPTFTDARSIGAILVDAGKLTLGDAEHVVQHSREHGLRFGDAAIKLGVLSESDVAFALSRQFEYPYLSLGASSVHPEVVAAYEPFSEPVEALRALRSQLLIRWFASDKQTKTLAITSASKGDGRSWLTANLGVVFAQLGARTLVLDADLRNPRQHLLFGTDSQSGVSTALKRNAPDVDLDVDVKPVAGLLNLSVMPAGPVPPNPQELLSRSAFDALLAELAPRFDVILMDTSPAAKFADAQAVASKAKGAIVVARRNSTSRAMTQSVAHLLLQTNVAIVGTLLNCD